jgi:hypothetical protein
MTFPVNHLEVVIYPKTDDAVLNKEPLGMCNLSDFQESLAVTRTMH